MKYVKTKQGNSIPKYFKDFRKIVDAENRLAEKLSEGYNEIPNEELGILLEEVSQGYDWLVELIDQKHLIYRPAGEKRKTVLLSSKQLDEFGNELTGIMNILEMNNLTLEGLEFAMGKDSTVAIWMMRKYIDTAYSQNEKLFKKLDEIAFLLLNNDNARELEALKNV